MNLPPGGGEGGAAPGRSSGGGGLGVGAGAGRGQRGSGGSGSGGDDAPLAVSLACLLHGRASIAAVHHSGAASAVFSASARRRSPRQPTRSLRIARPRNMQASGAGARRRAIGRKGGAERSGGSHIPGDGSISVSPCLSHSLANSLPSLLKGAQAGSDIPGDSCSLQGNQAPSRDSA
jgi:hypothetical protein